jgi:hypothetical protein
MSNNFPPATQIFDDLDKFRDFCRYEGKPYNEADLYNEKSIVWGAYKKYQGYLRAKARRKTRPTTPRRG